MGKFKGESKVFRGQMTVLLNIYHNNITCRLIQLSIYVEKKEKRKNKIEKEENGKKNEKAEALYCQVECTTENQHLLWKLE